MSKPHYTYVMVCPDTKERISLQEYLYSSGVCPRCGHDNNQPETHGEKVVGHWVEPKWWEELFLGKEAVFIKKGLKW